MDIAWRAEACPVGDATIYIAFAPFRQQLAALTILPPEALVRLDGSAVLQDSFGNRTELVFLSMRRPILDCVELKPGSESGCFRSVLLRCGFTSPAAEEYLRISAHKRDERSLHEPIEAGFVGASGLAPALESAFFSAIPRGPMPLSDFKAAIDRISRELTSGPCSETSLR